MTCKLMRQIIDIKCQNQYGEEYNFAYAVLCDAKIKEDCPKQRNPLMITPHCWRY